MSVNIENEYGDIDIKNYEDVITSIVQASLEFVGCPYPCEVNAFHRYEELCLYSMKSRQFELCGNFIKSITQI